MRTWYAVQHTRAMVSQSSLTHSCPSVIAERCWCTFYWTIFESRCGESTAAVSLVQNAAYKPASLRPHRNFSGLALSYFATCFTFSNHACLYVLSVLMQTFSWYYHYAGHTLMEHVLVFWVAPLMGAVVGGLLWRAFVADSPLLLGTKPLRLPVAKMQPTAARKQARTPIEKEL